MANPHKGEVEFESGERSYTLRFSANAICEMEDALGRGVAEIGALLGNPETLHMKHVRAVFWAGLQEKHKMTLDEAGEIITSIGLARVIELIGRAFEAAFPSEGGEANPPVPGQAQDGTGSAS